LTQLGYNHPDAIKYAKTRKGYLQATELKTYRFVPLFIIIWILAIAFRALTCENEINRISGGIAIEAFKKFR